MKIAHALFVLLIETCSVLSCFANFDSDPGRAFAHIYDGISKDAVSDKYRPVLLYRYANGESKFAATATVVKDATGNEYLITSAHVFSKRYQPARYLVCDIRPSDGSGRKIGDLSLDRGISSILRKEEAKLGIVDMAMSRDIVFCRLGKPVAIKSFYEEESLSQVTPAEASSRIEVYVSQEFRIRSLVSGKSYQVIANGWSSSNFSVYIADLDSWHGESGTGFVDESGRLYILCAKMKGMSIPWAKPREIRASLIGPVYPDSYSLALH